MRYAPVGERACSKATYRGEILQVRASGGVPVYLQWRGHLLCVATVEATWCVECQWWMDPTRLGTRRRYFRVHVCLPGGRMLCIEIFRSQNADARSGEWRLWRIAD